MNHLALIIYTVGADVSDDIAVINDGIKATLVSLRICKSILLLCMGDEDYREAGVDQLVNLSPILFLILLPSIDLRVLVIAETIDAEPLADEVLTEDR